jgi:hypothetical protein
MPLAHPYFVDPEAEFLFVPVGQVDSVVRKTGAIPYDTLVRSLAITVRNAPSMRL